MTEFKFLGELSPSLIRKKCAHMLHDTLLSHEKYRTISSFVQDIKARLF